jgi:hypothetical protein
MIINKLFFTVTVNTDIDDWPAAKPIDIILAFILSSLIFRSTKLYFLKE